MPAYNYSSTKPLHAIGKPQSFISPEQRKRIEEIEKNNIARSFCKVLNDPVKMKEIHASVEAERRKEKQSRKDKPDPLEAYYHKIFAPGALMITSGKRGGGKTHAAVTFAQTLVEGRFESMGKWYLATNIIFVTKKNGEIITDYPDGVVHITSLKDLFPLAAKALEEKANILLILDEAQNFLLGEHNGTSTVTSMKTFMGIIRKFNIAVWMLSPAIRNLGPSFRNFIDDPDDPGNVTGVWFKDAQRATNFLRRNGYTDVLPRDVIFHRDGYDSPVQALRIARTSWTTPPEKLKEGEHCYDHKASAEFEVGEDFDFKAFVKATGNISSFEMVRTIREFYQSVPAEKGDDVVDGETMAIRIASRIKSMGLTDESVERAVGIPATTLRRKASSMGLPWSVDKSPGNPDQYKRQKVKLDDTYDVMP